MCLWPFLNPILAILKAIWGQNDSFWGSKGVQIQFFFGAQNPMNSVCGQKTLKNFSDPATDTPAHRPAGRPLKGGPGRAVGLSDPSRTVGRPKKNVALVTKHYGKTVCLAKVMPKTRFFCFWPAFAILGPSRGPGQNPPESKNAKTLLLQEFSPKLFFPGFSKTLKGLAWAKKGPKMPQNGPKWDL